MCSGFRRCPAGEVRLGRDRLNVVFDFLVVLEVTGKSNGDGREKEEDGNEWGDNFEIEMG